MDLYEGKVVRLEQGDYNKMTVFSDNPIKTAQRIEDAGAGWLHIMDIEGVKNGGTPNFEIIKRLRRESSCSIEAGGGIRSIGTLRRYLAAGVKRVVLSAHTAVARGFLKQVVSEYGDRIVASVNICGGRVLVEGASCTGEGGNACLLGDEVDTMLEELCRAGVRTVICKDVSKEGTLSGANLDLYRNLMEKYQLDVIASGGVATKEDIRALRDMGLAGVVLGRSLYVESLSLAETLQLAESA